MRFKHIVYLLICLITSPIFAERASHWLQQPQVQNYITQQVKTGTFNRHDLSLMLSQAIIQPQVIQKINTPYEAQPWSHYRKHFITPSHLKVGRSFMKAHAKTLNLATQRYGVPQSIITAILGMESYYGQYQSPFKALDALTTLAFYYPQRADFFKKELTAYLTLVQRHHWSPRYAGSSYAGALGMPQFMPSNYLKYAISKQRHHTPDLFHRTDDAILSIAYYLQQAGWQRDGMIVVPATLSKNSSLRARTHWPMKIKPHALKTYGIQPQSEAHFNSASLRLWRLKGQPAHTLWVSSDNLSVLMRYNRSPLYAICAAMLAQALHL